MNEFEARGYAELAGAKAAFDEHERLRKLVEPLQDSMARHIVNSAPTATQIIEQQFARDLASIHQTAADIEAARAVMSAQAQSRTATGHAAAQYEQECFQNMIAPFHDPLASHLANLPPTFTQIVEQHAARDLSNLHRNLAEIEAARAVFAAQEQFHLPTWDSALERELKRMVTEDRLLAAAAPSAWLEAMKHSVQQRHHPWFNELEQTSSLRALAEMQILGTAINAVNPYSDFVTEATRKVLGDWSMVAELPKEIFTDAAARHDFYLAHGYDPALSTLPAAARVEGMYYSGLIDSAPSPVLVEKRIAAVVPDEPDGIALGAEAREILVGLERNLRGFIGTKMHALHGPQWTKQRVPAGIAQNIKERRAEDKKFNNKNHPPVEYLDFPDYAPIITRADNWEEVFKDYFLQQESVKESFRRLAPLRNAAMHSRPLTQEDMDFLYVEVRRLEIAMHRAVPTGSDDKEEESEDTGGLGGDPH